MNEAWTSGQEFYRGRRYVLLRSRWNERDVVLKAVRPDRRADPRHAAMLRHEYALLTRLNVPGVVRALALEEAGNCPMLVLEDAGRHTLAEWLDGKPADISRFFEIAIPLTRVLIELHDHTVIHRDISPSNIVLDDALRPTLVDFDTATHVTAVQRTAPSSGVIEGTFPYIAPEQTGRMSRFIDHRADLYAFGATLYVMLSGKPPFATADPAAAVHQVLAETPRPLHHLQADVPVGLSDLVMKLLNKMPERRYQSGDALLADLERAQGRWAAHGSIPSFDLGTRDRGRALDVPHALYGREREMALLSDALERARGGQRQIVMLGGPPGIGKSALVDNLRHQVGKDWFVAGACEQHLPAAPYGAVVDVMTALVDDIRRLPLAEITAFRDRVQAQMPAAANVLVDIAPQMERVFGRLPAPAPLGPAENENRLLLAFEALLRVCATSEHPIVVFLDNLQWADPGTMRLVELAATAPDVKHLLLIGAYRHEPPPRRLLTRFESLRRRGSWVQEVTLQPLGLTDVVALLSETFVTSRARVAPLAEVVFTKTQGNPLFLRRLLGLLRQSGALTFDAVRQAWHWDLAHVKQLAVGEDVLKLMLSTLCRSGPAVQDVLSTAACIGIHFDLWLLARVRDTSIESTASQLWTALHEGLLVPVPLRFTQPADTTHPSPGWQAAYRFTHERVRKAAYELLSEERAEAIHLGIARQLLHAPTEAELGRRLFELVDQFRQGAGRLTEFAERLHVAGLCQRAATKAMRSAAYASAFDYLQHGISLTSDDWHVDRALIIELYRDAAACAYMTGQTGVAETLLATARGHLESPYERVTLYSETLVALAATGRYDQAIAYGSETLALLDAPLPRGEELTAALPDELAAVEHHQRGRRVQDLLDAPEMRDPHALACMRVLGALLLPAWFVAPDLVALILTRLVGLSMQHGNAPDSSTGYTLFGYVLGTRRGELARGHAFALLGVELSRRFNDPVQESRALVSLGSNLSHWREPLHASVPILRLSTQRALEVGDAQTAAMARAAYGYTAYGLGQDLGSLLSELDASVAFAQRVGNRPGTLGTLAFRQAVRCLQGHTLTHTSFDDDSFQEEAFYAAPGQEAIELCIYETLRLQVAYLMRDLALASRMSETATPRLEFAGGLFCVAEHNLYTSLTWAAGATPASSETVEVLARIARQQQKLAYWADNSPDNFRHKHTLVAAEVARLEQRAGEAQTLYREATRAAERAGFMQDQALANELAGRHCLALGRHRQALPLLAAARASFYRWGALTKARALVEEFPALEEPTPAPWFAATEGLSGAALDLISVIKASETLSHELNYERLLERLLDVCLQITGAQRAALLLEEAGTLVLQATRAMSEPFAFTVHPARDSDELPMLILEEVRRTGDYVLLSDAVQESRFTNDPYIARRQVRSVLAVPVFRQATFAGVLYFENNLATRAFNEERVRVLQALSSQIAVSLANTQLFEKLTHEVQERRRAEAALAFLAQASTTLAESLDYQTTVGKLAHVAVPFLADNCAVEVLDDNGTPQLVGLVHVDPGRETVLRALTTPWATEHPASSVLRTGKSYLLSDVTDETLKQNGYDATLASIIRQIGVRTAMVVPLIAHGRVLGAMHLGSAVPGRRYDQSDLQLAQELARRVALAVENARLYREAQKAVQARDEFLSVASHELRTPLNALQLSAQVLAQRIHEGRRAEVMRPLLIIERQTKRLARLVDALLDVSRIHSGHLDIELEDVDLSEVIRDVTDRFNDALAQAKCPLLLRMEPRVVGRWDRMRLEQVITNLLSNAIKFGGGKPIEVYLGTRDGKVRLSVRDHGIGIPPDQQHAVFGRFERAVSARSYGGLGLGLYITRTIVQTLGGTITVDSEPGKGSTFVVELPREPTPLVRVAQPREKRA